MKRINRIFIEGQQGNCGDAAYKFVKDVLKRRYGNGVTFALDEEKQKILSQLELAGFKAKLDEYSWNLNEPSDFFVGNEISLTNDFNMKSSYIIKDIVDDVKHGLIAKLKYKDRPRKKAVWIKVTTKEGFKAELKKELDPYDAGLDINSLV